MRMRLFLVLVLCSGLVFPILAGIELSEGFECGRGFSVLVPDELAVAKGDIWQDFVNFFFTVVQVHILGAYFVLFLLVADYPVAASWMEADLFCNFAENVVVDHD